MYITRSEYEAMLELFPSYMAVYWTCMKKAWARNGNVYVAAPTGLRAGLKQRVQEAREHLTDEARFAVIPRGWDHL